MRLCHALGGFFLGFIMACCTTTPQPPASQAAPHMTQSRQLVVVRSADWSAFSGMLQRYERSEGGGWQEAGPAVPVVVGRNGLGWGIGLHPRPGENGAPVKVEGDGKAPAGIFALGPAFGYDPPGNLPPIRLPYIQSGPSHRCVDDPASRHYNRIVVEGQTDKDWNSSEDMLRNDDLYRIGLVVRHNWGPGTERGKGSCIFLHLKSSLDKGTAGCTAMRADDLIQLLAWLDPDMNPVLVQLPHQEYTRLRRLWQLP